MEDAILEETNKNNSKQNSSEFIKRIDNYLEKGSIEHLIQENVKEKNFQESSDDKDIDKEKSINELNSSDKNLKFNAEDSTKFTKPYNKNFNFEILNRDLADIEERLRATRLSWNKSGKSVNESSEIDAKDVVRKSWSLLDIEKRPYSNGSSINDLNSNKMISGEKLNCESPALSDGLLKWDYGADIGLTQDDSDDMEPITWPVTAEQAQRDSHLNEHNAIGRRMKMSLSQGSFLSSPDPEDRHNIIAKISAEYKSNKALNSIKHKDTAASTEIICKTNGIYDDLSAKQIMEQAEEAEKRLRLRLESVKALHFNDSSRFQETDAASESPMENHNSDINGGIPSPNFSDSRMSRDARFDRNASNNELMNATVKNQQNKLIEDIVSDVPKPNCPDEDCRSPTSLSNTGRTTTMESTHASSNYGKAPVFTGDIYGSRKDTHSNESGFVMYSKQTRDTFIGKSKSPDNKEMRNPRIICGIPPELDTISSRETLQITDEKKDDLLSLTKTNNNNTVNFNEGKNSDDHLSDKDVSQEYSLQAKWNQFKTMMKDDEYNNLIEKTNIRSAIQYNNVSHTNGKSNDHGNTNRQVSTATTFTTITNISPRYDSFATEVFRNPHKEFHDNERNFISKRTGSQEDKNRSNSGIIVENKIYRTGNQRYNSNQDLPSRSKSGKRLTTGGGGGGRDNEDNDDEKSQTERRKLRHTAELAKFKKRFGSGALDGETTASELEHDDLSKFKRNLIEKDNRKKQLSHMLTEISKQGVADESVHDFTDVSESSSVDTMLLMNKMSHLLRKKGSDNNSKRDFKKYHVENPDKRHVERSKQKEKPKRIIESDDAKLILKHLMLKQKVKWLADCAREEARRRKIRKLQKLLDLYEHGNPIIIPDDLETDTATLMGSNRNSREDLCSHSDSYSVYDSDVSDTVDPVPPKVAEGNFHLSKKKKYPCKSPLSQKHRNDSKENFDLSKKEQFSNNKQKSYPVSEAWHIPLREPDSQKPIEKDFNDSNEYQCDSPVSGNNNQNLYRQSCCNPYSQTPDKPVNLTARERLKLRRELELARQRNAHECEKDLRHMKTGDTKVTRGGLSWAFGSSSTDSNNLSHSKYKEGNRKSWMNAVHSDTDSSPRKSGLQSAFESKMESFISRSRQRQKRIKLAMEERRYESQMNLERSRLFASNNEGGGLIKRRPVTQPDPLSADRQIKVSPKRKLRNHFIKSSSVIGTKSPISERLYKPRRRNFSKNEMRFQSAKKYQTLPEVQAKYLDERRKARIQNNRMKMHLYGERILQSLLRNRGPWVTAQS